MATPSKQLLQRIFFALSLGLALGCSSAKVRTERELSPLQNRVESAEDLAISIEALSLASKDAGLTLTVGMSFMPDPSSVTDVIFPIGFVPQKTKLGGNEPLGSLSQWRNHVEIQGIPADRLTRPIEIHFEVQLAAGQTWSRVDRFVGWPRRFEQLVEEGSSERVSEEFVPRFTLEVREPSSRQWRWLGPVAGLWDDFKNGGVWQNRSRIPAVSRILGVTRSGRSLSLSGAISQVDESKAVGVISALESSGWFNPEKNLKEIPFEWIVLPSESLAQEFQKERGSVAHAFLALERSSNLIDLGVAYVISATRISLWETRSGAIPWFLEGTLRYVVRKALLNKGLLTPSEFLGDVEDQIAQKNEGDLVSFLWNQDVGSLEILVGALLTRFEKARSDPFNTLQFNPDREFDSLVREKRRVGALSEIANLSSAFEVSVRQIGNLLGGPACVEAKMSQKGARREVKLQWKARADEDPNGPETCLAALKR